jgi:hypothetical protein
MRALAAALLFFAGAALAQEVADAPGARLRVLDKLTGDVQDVTLAAGQSQSFGRLTVQLDACRYQPENPTAEAFGLLTIGDAASDAPVFAGWMVASSPGLSALDHPRYDVWVLRCDVPDLVLPDVEEAPAEDGAATDDGNG